MGLSPVKGLFALAAPVSAPLKAWNGEPGSTLIETGAPGIAACFAGPVYIAKRTFGRGRQDDRLERVFMPSSRHSRCAQEWPSEVVGSLSDHGGSSRCTYRVGARPRTRARPNAQLLQVPARFSHGKAPQDAILVEA
jgi:hypothetical protein